MSITWKWSISGTLPPCCFTFSKRGQDDTLGVRGKNLFNGLTNYATDPQGSWNIKPIRQGFLGWFQASLSKLGGATRIYTGLEINSISTITRPSPSAIWYIAFRPANAPSTIIAVLAGADTFVEIELWATGTT